jgi:hypothetical protein
MFFDTHPTIKLKLKLNFLFTLMERELNSLQKDALMRAADLHQRKDQQREESQRNGNKTAKLTK